MHYAYQPIRFGCISTWISTKIGPITAKYKGTAPFTERDDVEHRAVIAARGREAREWLGVCDDHRRLKPGR